MWLICATLTLSLILAQQGSPPPSDSTLPWINLVGNAGAWGLLVWLITSQMPKIQTAFEKAQEGFRAETFEHRKYYSEVAKQQREECAAETRALRDVFERKIEVMIGSHDKVCRELRDDYKITLAQVLTHCEKENAAMFRMIHQDFESLNKVCQEMGNAAEIVQLALRTKVEGGH